ncbi:DNA internalization-related competence protein ComEC/Rec2 [Bordetella genomosp. 13]|uniref:DNA internalization-related competence protein ComEC/Rec2 n=1 Tax=Bordetella genomosp. 13 TaxID=463040 RepID=A0A1W6ZBD0_9BORD|nr:DNA internalization-related competence protein ComEC/Rec2 [Bordetella genomosp. 13]ARP94555.1 DNA internalization-related competence protein ComEC/Rec2 [Bordetella genomosp. 13]
MLGSAAIHTLARLPACAWLWAAASAALVSIAGAFVWRHRAGRLSCVAAAGLLAGMANAGLQAQARLHDALADAHNDQVTRLTVLVVSLPRDDAGQRRFVAEADASRPAGVPARLRVTWNGPPGEVDRLPEVLPGQRWRMALVLRRPYGPSNPHAWDAELRDFAEGVRAVGTVRGRPQLVEDDPWATPGVAIERLRQHIRTGMREAMQGHRYGPVLIALAIGDQAGVAREDWQVFNRTGITHLVSISGMHVTMMAAAGGLLATWLWRRVRWRGVGLAEYLPAQLAGGVAALVVALAYCLLAGWGVPARRTFFMLAVVALAGLSRLPLGASRVLLLAGGCVVALDPWALLAPGFWLSFGAVAVLMRVAENHRPPPRGPRERVRATLREFVRVQGAITLALTPLLAFLMHQVSLASPLANAIAIPIVGTVVTQLALLCGALAAIPGAQPAAWLAGWIGHALFAAVMVPVAWIGQADWAALDVAAAPWPLMMLALAGCVWALQAPGWPLRHLGWLCALPLLCWRPERPPPGDWRMTALDVGQGTAIVVETATRVLVYDAGPRRHDGTDAAERVLVPYLHARGVRALDALVISHADLDHAGGLRSVLAAMPVAVSYASFDISAHLRREGAKRPDGWNEAPPMPHDMQACEAGMEWKVDEVTFRFVHPPAAGGRGGVRAAARASDDNARSCVLLVQGRTHAMLLPGDAGTAQEALYAAELPSLDLVAAPHHGSNTSSGNALVRAAEGAHVIVQAGHLNRFRHPAAAVVARWRAAGATLWRTDLQGAILARSSPDGLRVWAQRDAARRYWHAPLDERAEASAGPPG